MILKFAHLADCHLGSWKHPELQKLNLESFNTAIEKCIQEKVNFVLIAGDLFDTAIPSIDILKKTAEKFRELKENKINCYIIAGSHDFSVSGKSMISVFEKAGLCREINLENPVETEDYFITGLAGEKKGLEIKKIKNIDNEKETRKETKEKNKLKILALHTTLKEMELPFIDSVSVDELPSGFDYYALGHIHKKAVFEKEKKQGNEKNNKQMKSKVVYPGALFPCNFSEIEKNSFGSFFIIKFENDKLELKEIPVKLKETLVLEINADNENPKSLEEKIFQKTKKEKIKERIIALRISGVLASGKPSEINFKEIDTKLREEGAFCILRNTSKLITKEFEITDEKIKELKLETLEMGNIEKQVIREMTKQKILDSKDEEKVFELMKCLDTEKIEGETNENFALRLTNDIVKKLKLTFVPT